MRSLKIKIENINSFIYKALTIIVARDNGLISKRSTSALSLGFVYSVTR